MVRLLSARFDGMGQIRSIDPNALLVQAELKTEGEIAPTVGVEVARRFNAESFVIGSVLRIGGPIQVSANMYDRDGTSVGYSEVTIAADSLLLTAVDRVAQELLAGKFEGPAQAMTSMAVQSTTSFDALRDYLQGEELMHAGLFNDAKPLFRSAIDKDSTFALAWLRLSDAYGWTNWTDPMHDESIRRAEQLSSRLPELVRERLTIEQMLRNGDFERALAGAERLHQKHPDDIQTLLLLGDYQWHYNAYFGKPANDAEPYFRDVLRIDPTLAEAKFHLIELLIRTDRFAEAESLGTTTQSNVFAFWGQTAKLAAASSDGTLSDEQASDMLGGLDEIRIARQGALLASLAGRPKTARQVMTLLQDEQQPAASHRTGQYEREMITAPDQLNTQKVVVRQMSGQFGPSLDALRARDSVSSTVLAGMLTFYPFEPSDLELVASRFEEPTDTVGAGSSPDVLIFADNLPAIAAFRLALVDWRRDDMDALRNRQRQLAAMSEGKLDNNLAHSFANLLDALLLWKEGRIDDADAAFRSSTIPIAVRLTAWPYFNLGINRFLHGQMLHEAGRYEESLRWLSAVEDGFLHWSDAKDLLFPAMYTRAQNHEQLGEIERAIELYGRFIRAWEDADPALQPMVEDARGRLEALMLRRRGAGASTASLREGRTPSSRNRTSDTVVKTMPMSTCAFATAKAAGKARKAPYAEEAIRNAQDCRAR